MLLIWGIHSLAGAGGSESYVITVADHLQRTGHDVIIFSRSDGLSGDIAREFGLPVVIGSTELPNDADAVLVQDRVAAFELLEALPAVPQIYNWHSEYFDLQLPPQIDNVVKLNIVLHADALRRVKSLAVKTPILQLTHPVDTMRFKPLTALNDRPRRLLALGNYLQGAQEERLRSACEIAGIEFRHVGDHGEGPTTRPELAMNDTDIVAGKAKVIIEAMACGRAAYVYDQFGNDGWVTPETYPLFEANCFAGRTTRRELNAHQIAEELRTYRPEMGDANRALVVEHHSAMTHAGQLVEAIEPIVAARGVPVPNDSASELARLAQTNWRHEKYAYTLTVRLKEQSRQMKTLEDQLHAMKMSRRWRAVRRIMAPLDKLRGWR